MTLEPCSVCQSPAAWTCTACGPKCAQHVRRVKGGRQTFRCDACGQAAQLRQARRSELTRFDSRIKPSLALLGRPLLAAFAGAVALWLVKVLSLFGLLLGLAVAIPLGLKLLRSVADAEDYEWPAPAQAAEELGVPLARALAACAPVLVAAHVCIYEVVVKPYQIAVTHPYSLAVTLLRAPTFWLAMLLVLLVVPFSLLNATVAQTWGQVANPVAALKPISKFRREWGLITGVAAGAFVVAFLLGWLAPKGLFSSLFPAFAASYGFFVVCRLLGEFLHLHPAEFGWGRVDEELVDLGDPNAPALWEPKVEAPKPAANMATTLEGQLSAALDTRDVTLAITLFKGTPDANKQLSPGVLLRFGQAAASVSEYSLALDALLSAGRSTSPDAAKAIVIGARILDERLRDHSGAKRLYQQVVQRFPGTQAEAFARKQLADPRFFLIDKTG